MAYNEDLAHRIRELIADEPDVREQKMFGGLAFLITGHVGRREPRGRPDGGRRARADGCPARQASHPHVRVHGRAMEGWLRVDAEGVETLSQLAPWVELGVAHARSLPPK